ncbi:unannotated protein [freshwater metagenome]|uniref:transketolase n=1 Tax=freshwater metagenome TaxID=449393 RepID=A0A6J7VD01_9ZZZZ
MPVFDRTIASSAEGVAKGAYILKEASSKPSAILIATGSEVSLAMSAQEILEAEGVPTRVVSAPCLEWFAEQSPDYRETVIPASVPTRVSIEAGIAMGWRDLVGDKGSSISIEHFGASASASVLFKEFGFTAQAIVSEVKRLLS